MSEDLSPGGTAALSAQRGRPTRARAEAIDRIVVETARTMFLDCGYGATAMEAIAARAGVSKGTLYSRYPSKDALFAAVVEDRVKVWSVRLAWPEAPLPDLAGRLEHHARAVIDSMGDPDVAGFATMMMSARPRFPELAQIYFDRAVLHHINVVADEIAGVLEPGAVAEGDAGPMAIAYALLEAAYGWATIHTMRGGDYPPEAVRAAVRGIVRRTLRGFGLPEGSAA